MCGIAVLGWGSLIWDRDGLPVDLPDEHQWNEDGPVVPLEFVRQSQDEQLALVIWKDGEPTKVRWAPMKVTSLPAAVLALREREGRFPPIRIREKHVGVWSRGADGNAQGSIGPWAEAMPFDHVIWTALPSKWRDIKGDLQEGLFPTKEEAVAHLMALVSEGKGAKAKDYVRKAPPWVRTPYREAFEQELGWTYKPE